MGVRLHHLCGPERAAAAGAGPRLSAPPIRAVMAVRVRRMLSIAARHGNAAVVLGAWGCGAFGCHPDDVAPAFAEALTGPWQVPGLMEAIKPGGTSMVAPRKYPEELQGALDPAGVGRSKEPRVAGGGLPPDR